MKKHFFFLFVLAFLFGAKVFGQEYDSCIYYGRKVFDFYGDKTSKFQLKHLYKAYKGLGDDENAALFAEMLINLQEDYGAEQKAIAEVKDEYEKQLEINQLRSKQQVKRYRLYLWIAILPSCSMCRKTPFTVTALSFAKRWGPTTWELLSADFCKKGSS